MSNSSFYYYKKKVNKGKIVKDIIIIYIITVMTVIMFNSFLFQAFKVPSHSMSPTLDNNTRIIVDKFSIGPKIPCTNKRFFDSTAKNLNRGDVVVFMSNEYYKKNVFMRSISTLINTLTFTTIDIVTMKNKYDSNIYVKRIIGLPGDTIQFKIMDNNVIIVQINGLQEKEVILSQYQIIEENRSNSKLLSAMLLHNEITIPENQYYLLGDNRAGSSDSRVFGSINKNQIIGKAIFKYWPTDKFGVMQ
ncbi:MAG: hypothetical protein A2015_09365 [Spirochaetes bacterium GWF1_31_7]|nr:MAG: hypothetical protein A2Y30_08855 [Spirochaetes bacterium GWE1_32_154]OHD45699.1 MAG: hypothetical protein A2Y29_10280 [Spirochaetes bacterium GWE2_31_10]OHD47693.1 MAG: hypothetical protein A2015_09365 [Spirochaetes bacterium GWF1_31_7]HBD94798.1 hypothetical protein [Spirochaetia bacterium]